MTVADITKLPLVTTFNTTACFPNILNVIFHISLELMFRNCRHKAIIAIIAKPSHYRLHSLTVFHTEIVSNRVLDFNEIYILCMINYFSEKYYYYY
jgi:hypothetical protein